MGSEASMELKDLDKLAEDSIDLRHELSLPLEEQWVEFLRLYPKLKGRQRQIIDLIMSGVYRRSVIAKKLGMKLSNVSIELKKISKKIL